MIRNMYAFVRLSDKTRDLKTSFLFQRTPIVYFTIFTIAIAVLIGLVPHIRTLINHGPLPSRVHPSSLTAVKTKKHQHLLCTPQDFVGKQVSQSQYDVGESSTAEKQPVVSQRKVKGSSDINAECNAARNLAREMALQGKTDKAIKIYEHALAMSPNHPDLLNEYGEFLEESRKDILSAEHHYCRALMASPSHTQAMANRKRTLPLVEEIDQNFFNRIDRKRDMLVQVPDHHPGLRRMVKENYFRHIYHTTAIEGNTFTLSQTRSLVENRLAIGGKSIIEHNEILGMDAALNYVNASLIQRIGAITIKDILEIHRRVLGFVDPVGAGMLRTTQVFVGEFTPPDAREVQDLTEEFVEWLNSEDALSLHPIELAALAHYKFVYIHPFYDGNGRTSRLLMNLVLMQASYPPIIIQKEEKHEYYHHLQTANDGDVRPFMRFIARCTERTMDEYLVATIENFNVTFPSLSLAQRDDGRTIILDQD